MNFTAKFLAFVFSILTALGIMPKTIPFSVVLGEISGQEAVISTDKYTLYYDEGSFSLAMDGRTRDQGSRPRPRRPWICRFRACL